MNIEITLESSSILADYARIPIAFTVDRVLDMEEPFKFKQRTLEQPYIKDYDAFEGESPANWATRFDLSKWGFVIARHEERIVGGAAIAFDSPDIYTLEGRRDLAVLWDIRVFPEFRGRSIGARLFETAQQWAINHGCRAIKIETQNTNVAACRFYQRQGCRLDTIIKNFYPKLPDEICLQWTFPLHAPREGQ